MFSDYSSCIKRILVITTEITSTVIARAGLCGSQAGQKRSKSNNKKGRLKPSHATKSKADEIRTNNDSLLRDSHRDRNRR
jgi:hypothetical protein